jgi:hypothetical protein
MVNDNLNKIFLSASIPYSERDKKYYESADILAIRDSVRALATVVIPKAHLIWGGHPSITPLIRFVMNRMNVNVKDHVTLYQSLYFEKFFPKDNCAFENIVLTDKVNDEKESILIMRKQMFSENDFQAGVFIGGMEGIEAEYELFTAAHPDAKVLPIGSTGAAAKVVFEKYKNERNFDTRLLNDYAYMSLFKHLLSNYIN